MIDKKEIDRAFLKHIKTQGLFIPRNNLDDYREDDSFTGFKAGYLAAMEKMKNHGPCGVCHEWGSLKLVGKYYLCPVCVDTI